MCREWNWNMYARMNAWKRVYVGVGFLGPIELRNEIAIICFFFLNNFNLDIIEFDIHVSDMK